MAKPTLLSGVKPTGYLHLGNYFGALRQFVAMQEEYDCYFMIADYHALNFIRDKEEMKRLSLDIALDYLAIGLAPETIFKQSDVPEHTELAWIFETITPIPYLKRAHAYKDAVAKGEEDTFSAGDFNYPMLMAADILLYDTEVVPVGKDQQQHLEYARDTAERFNRIYEEVFTLPKAHILDDVATVPGIDGRKMSKSYDNTIGFFASREEIQKRVMSIVTDSSGTRPEHVYAIHSLVKSPEELEELYRTHEGQYKVLKEALIEDLDAFIAPFRDRRDELAYDAGRVCEIVKKGGERAKNKAKEKMEAVRRVVGVTI